MSDITEQIEKKKKQLLKIVNPIYRDRVSEYILQIESLLIKDVSMNERRAIKVVKSVKEINAEIDEYLSQCAPHIKQRKAAQLLIKAQQIESLVREDERRRVRELVQAMQSASMKSERNISDIDGFALLLKALEEL